jgi:hypothetical protein
MKQTIAMFQAVTPEVAHKLSERGFHTTEDLVKLARGASSFRSLGKELGLEADLAERLVKTSMLARVDGITPPVAELLYLSGVDSVADLRDAKPESLLRRMSEVNQEGKFVDRLPTRTEIENWNAKETPAATVSGR